MRILLSGIGLLLAIMPVSARADLLLYRIPGTASAFVIQGEVEMTPGRIVTLRHPQFGTIHFDHDMVQVYKAASTLRLAQNKLRRAGNDADACIEAARWALHHGLLDEFYKAASAAYRANPKHPTVERLVRLKRLMDAPIPIDKNQEAELRKYVTTHDDMEFVYGKHFVLMHNTKPPKSSARGKGRKKNLSPAEQRLELLEMVYQSFLLKFWLEGMEVEVPKERLKVVLFAHQDDFVSLAMAKKMGHMSKASGVYNKEVNIALFYDQATSEGLDELDKINTSLKEDARLAASRRDPRARNLVRFSNSLNLVCERMKSNLDIEVVTHEATHQMAGNTGLMPNDSGTPVWVAEGIATYFESPKEAAWAGIGGVNEERLKLYRAMAGDEEHAHIDFIVSDDVFMRIKPDRMVIAYGPSWALTHFLMAHHFEKLKQYYALLAKRKTKDFKPFSAEENLALFKKVFGEDTDTLNAQWHRYMQKLKTDIEQIIDGDTN